MINKLIEAMQKQWIEFCKRNNAIGDPLHNFEKIKEQYSIPQRYYHTFAGHIAQGLEIFSEFRYLCKDPDLIYFHWMNHDAIYDPRKKDNEEKSADFSANLAREMHLPIKFEENSGNLILPTKHQIIPEGFDIKFHLDMDLSIFGQPESIFDAYEENIWKEYKDIYPPEVYNPGRAEILKMFWKRKPLYRTLQIREKYEEKAKANLQRSIEKLSL